MRGIAGRQTRGLPTAARLHVADNTGAKIVQIVNILKLGGTMRRYPAGGVGDLLECAWAPWASQGPVAPPSFSISFFHSKRPRKVE